MTRAREKHESSTVPRKIKRERERESEKVDTEKEQSVI